MTSAGLSRVAQASIPAQGTAATTQTTTLMKAPFDGTLAAASLISNADLTADASHYRTFTLINKGQDGNGTAAMAALDTSTTGFTDFDERAMTLSGTAANLDVNEGDIIAVAETVTGNGVAHGQLLCVLKLTYDVNE